MNNMANAIFQDTPSDGVSQSFITILHFNLSKGLPHAEPLSTLRTDEEALVTIPFAESIIIWNSSKVKRISSSPDQRTQYCLPYQVQGVLRMLQGFSSSLLFWDESRQSFYVKNGMYVSHLSQTSLRSILDPFIHSGTCLKQVELFVKKVKASYQRSPTLEAFANSVYLCLKRLRHVALKEEMSAAVSDTGKTSTLLRLTNSLSSLCSGAEYLFQVVAEAVPSPYFECETSIPAGELAVHILDHLFEKLNEVCLVQGGEEEAYHMLLAIFAGSLLPYLEGLDSWLYDGNLDDPYEEMFFYGNNAVTVDQPAFWERSYLLRLWSSRELRSGTPLLPTVGEAEVRKEASSHEHTSFSITARGKDRKDTDIVVPVFLKNMAGSILSAGKSLQLIQHVQDQHVAVNLTDSDYDSGRAKLFTSGCILTAKNLQVGPQNLSSQQCENDVPECAHFDEPSTLIPRQISQTKLMGLLTLSEAFLVSLSGLIGEGYNIYEYLSMPSSEIAQMCKSFTDEQKFVKGIKGDGLTSVSFQKMWCKFSADAVLERDHVDIGKGACSESTVRVSDCSCGTEEEADARNILSPGSQHANTENVMGDTLVSLCLGNPVITVCREFLKRNVASWNELNISGKFHLPPLNDEKLRESIFNKKCTVTSSDSVDLNKRTLPRLNGTDYTFGFQFGALERLHLEDGIKTLETLFPFPTLIPCFQEDLPMSELLPFQKNSTLASRVLEWIHNIKLRCTSLPAVIVEECLVTYVKNQVDHVGRHILLKLMSDWKLMDELCVLRAIYLLGSGDLLQQFLVVIFDRLDRGDSWDDDFELNTILQESIRNSADGALLGSPDSLVVSITNNNNSDDEENVTGNVSTPRKVRNHCFGIDALDILKFTYKVSWPLDLIANMEAIKKYNQVMGFLLKVKRAKFVLDKTRRWMWKSRGSTTYNYKHHLLVQQKLLHFVDAFHQYVMDRVFHNAWIELCSGMASAGSLDEVIEVHEAYLLSVQRQCFVAPDKVWALIASRIKSILGLALDFYSIQQTLSSGGAASAIKARCEMEVDRIERQFDDCIAFLLRILSFKLNVGQFPHLVDLVTRINYNYFYMSESGNLQTIPTFETAAAKVGKTLVFRTD